MIKVINKNGTELDYEAALALKYEKAILSPYSGNLWIYSWGSLIESLNVDRSFSGYWWCLSHGLKVVGQVATEDGARFDIWKGRGYACAVPAEIRERIESKEA